MVGVVVEVLKYATKAKDLTDNPEFLYGITQQTHKLRFIASGGMFGGRGGTGPSSQIIQWVEQNFTATQIDGVTMYDLAT